jgi:hypothetical protein
MCTLWSTTLEVEDLQLAKGESREKEVEKGGGIVLIKL